MSCRLCKSLTTSNKPNETMKSITVTINKQGIPKVEAHGFQGGACATATKPITDAFGGQGVSEDKPEMFIATGIESSATAGGSGY